MKLFRSVLAITIALLMVLSLAACTDKPSVDGAVGKVIELEDCTIKITGCEKIIDSDDKPAIRVWYDVTNNSEETNNACYLHEIVVTQDGYELTDTYANYEIAVDAADADLLNIRPGVTIRICDEFNFKEDGGTIVCAFKEYYSEEEPVTVEFDPANLPGAPTDELVVEKVSDPQWVSDLSAEGTYEAFGVGYGVKVEKFDFTENFDGDRIIRIYYEFTNNSTEKESFNMNVTSIVYQDGIELESAYPMEEIEEDSNYHTEIEPGESIKLAYSYELTSDSPVEVEVRDINGGGVGTVFEIK